MTRDELRQMPLSDLHKYYDQLKKEFAAKGDILNDANASVQELKREVSRVHEVLKEVKGSISNQ